MDDDDDFWAPSPRNRDNATFAYLITNTNNNNTTSQLTNQQSQSSTATQHHNDTTNNRNHPQLTNRQPQSSTYTIITTTQRHNDRVTAILNEAHRHNILTYDEFHERQQNELRRSSIYHTAIRNMFNHQHPEYPVMLNDDFVRRLIRANQPITETSQISQQTQTQIWMEYRTE